MVHSCHEDLVAIHLVDDPVREFRYDTTAIATALLSVTQWLASDEAKAGIHFDTESQTQASDA